MSFLGYMLSFPTVIYSFFLCICIILWLLTALGLLGLEGAEIDASDIGDAGAGPNYHIAGEAMGLLSRFGFNGIPITLLVTLLALFGWVISFLAQSLILKHFSSIFYYLAGLVVFLVSFVATVYLTAIVCRPLRIVFKSQTALRNKHLIGRVVTVSSLTVDSNYGEAFMEDGGAGLLLQIRAHVQQQLKKGDKVVLLEYLQDISAYRVISEEEFKGI